MKKIMTACTIAAMALPFAAQADTVAPKMKTTMMTQSTVEGATSSAMDVQQSLALAIIVAALFAAMSKSGGTGGVIAEIPPV